MFRTNENWTFKIKAINGGLQETNDIFMNLSPEDGYKESIVYKFKRKDKDRIDNKYYFTSRNGQVYGRLRMAVRPYLRGKNKSTILFDYVVNMNADRNLTVKEPN